MGGFGRNRLILDKVEYVSLDTKLVDELPPMPGQVYSPAVCYFRDRLVVIKSQIWVYDPDMKSWSILNLFKLPKHIEFNRALVHENHIYLTGNHAYELYRFDPDEIQPYNNETIEQEEEDERIELELIGKFSYEAQNVCLVGSTIYNFSTDQFEYNSTIETFDISTKSFNVLWEKETDEFDFSPYHSSGCFSLVIY